MPFHFVRGILGDATLLSSCRQEIEKIIHGDFTPKNIEKLQNHDIYSLRMGAAERLLFSIIEINKEKHLLVLDYLPTHDYHKSRFLRSGVLAHYQDKIIEEHLRITQDVSELHFEPLANIEPLKQIKAAQNEIIVDFYQHRWITLDSAQNEVLEVKLPAVINGSAGSGKTCIALTLLANAIQQQLNMGGTGKFLYVTQNQFLVEKMKQAWKTLPIAVDITEVIEFKTYNELFTAAAQFAEIEYFLKWFKEKSQVKTQRMQKDNIFAILDEDALYEEFRICSGYTPPIYLELGTRQSLVPRELRKNILDALNAYQQHLLAQNVIDTKLCIPEFTPSYQMVVVDEAQDFSHAQIVSISKLANDKQIICFMDSHQRLHDRLSIRPFLLNLLEIPKDSASHVQLTGTYRCPPKIMDAANQVIHLKHLLVQGIADKFEATKIDSKILDTLGHVHLTSLETIFSKAWARTANTNIAIVTSEQNKIRARELFQTPLVFSPKEIKGLEYEIIISWELLDEDFFKRALKRFLEVKDKKTVTGRATENDDESFIAYLNALFTVFTRAEHRLILCERPNRENSILIDLLKTLHDDLPDTLNKSTLDFADWQAEMTRQLQQGNREQAQLIFKMKLSGTAQEFADYESSVLLAAQTSKTELTKPNTLVAAMPPQEIQSKAPIASSGVKQDKANQETKKPKPILKAEPPKPVGKALVSTTAKPRDKTLTCANIIKSSLDTHGVAIILSSQYPLISEIMLGKYFNDDSSEEKYSLIEWILKCPHRTKTLIKDLLHHVALFLHPIFSFQLQSELKLNDEFVRFCEFKEIFIKAHKFKTLQESLDSSILHYIISESKNVDKFITGYVELGGDINFSIKNFSAPLLAVQNGRADIIKILHKFNADLNLMPTHDSVTPIYLATQLKNIRLIKLLHELGADLNLPARFNGMSVACMAAQTGDEEVIETIHELGVDLNQLSPSGQAPIHIAMYNNLLHMIAPLHRLGINLSLLNKVDEAPIHIAANKNDLRMLFQLYALNADINLTNNAGLAAIHLAALKGNVHFITELCKLGADVNKIHPKLGAAIHIATDMQHIELMVELNRLGANLNLIRNDGKAPLHLAVENEHLKTTNCLCRMGANIDLLNAEGQAAIHIAMCKKSFQQILQLHALGADLTQLNIYGQTPAQIAQISNFPDGEDIIEQLINTPQITPRFFKERPTSSLERNHPPSP